MIYIHSSKIAIITKFNKYTTDDDYIKLFMTNLYKNKDSMKQSDEEEIEVKFVSEADYLNTVVLDNVSEKIKTEINNIINEDITSNNTLITTTAKLQNIVENLDDLSDKGKHKIKNELESRINCNYGTNTENIAIKLYEAETGHKVYNNNSKLYVHKYKQFAICGKTDGFVKIDDKEYIFETKNRKSRLFKTIPIYEKIQLLAYTVLCKNNNIIFTQCINNKIDIKQLINYCDEDLWNSIIYKLTQYVVLINKLQTEKLFRHSFIVLPDENKYEFLQGYLNWL